MKKILILQFRKISSSIESEIGVYTRAFRALPVSLEFKNIFNDPIDWENPESICKDADAVMLGGSGDLFFDGGLEQSDEAVLKSCELAQCHAPLLSYLAEHHIPTLGICFGHQILAYARGVQVLNDREQAKVGSHEVVLTEEGRNDPLFQGMQPQFTVQYGHQDSLSTLPEGAVLLAYGEQCQYSALRHGLNRYSVQFHPELTEEDMRMRCIANPDYLPQGSSVETAIRDSHHSEQIFHNFVFRIMHADDVAQCIEEAIRTQEDMLTTQ